MGRKFRNFLKGIAVLVATVAVLLEMDILNLPGLAIYSFWILVISFAVVLIASR
ncbi:MAG: twin-arginine translocation signal domain-containing protein [Cyclobacteriaceae bacterium]